MAKDTQSCYDRAYARFVNPANTQVLESYHFSDMQSAKSRNSRICPWGLPSNIRPYATAHHIPFSVMSPHEHPHGFHAALRNMQIIDVFPSFLTAPTTVLWMSESNVSLLRDFVSVPVKVCNPMLEIKDLGRFTADKSFPQEVFRMGNITTPIVLGHDNGHYWTSAGVLRLFEENPAVNVMVLTHVYPLSVAISDVSPEPALYRYQVSGETLIYIPEGDWGGRYEQPVKNDLLLTRTIYNPVTGMSLNCGIVDSKLNSHVQIITRFNLPGAVYGVIAVEDYMPMPKVFRSQPSSQMIPVKTYKSLYRYAKVLVGAKEKDMWGKVRQMADEFVDTLNFSSTDLLCAVVLEVAKHGVPEFPVKHYHGLAQLFLYKTVGHLSRLKAKVVDRPHYERYARLVNEPQVPMVVPLLNARVISESLEGMDMVWEVPAEFKARHLRNAWLFVKHWWKGAHIREPLNSWADIDIDDEGNVIPDGISFKSLTPFWLRQASAAEIEAAQTAVFLQMYGNSQLPTTRELNKRSKMAIQAIRDGKPDLLDPALKPVFKVDWSLKPDNVSRAEYMQLRLLEELSSDTDPTIREKIKVFEDLPFCTCCQKSKVGYCDCKVNLAVAAKLNKCGCCKEHMVGVCLCGDLAVVKQVTVMESVAEEEFVGAGVPEAVVAREVLELVARPAQPSVMPGLVEERQRVQSVNPPVIPLGVPEDLTIEVDADDASKGLPAQVYTVPVEVVVEEVLSPATSSSLVQKVKVQATGEDVWKRYYGSVLKDPYRATGFKRRALWDDMFPHTAGKRHTEDPGFRVLYYPLNLAYPAEDCLLECFKALTTQRKAVVYLALSRFFPASDMETLDKGLSTNSLEILALSFGLNIGLLEGGRVKHFGVKEGPVCWLSLANGHFVVDLTRTKLALTIHSRSISAGRNWLSPNARKLVSQMSKLPIIKWHSWTPEFPRAELYVRAMQDGSGLIGKNPANFAKLKGWEDAANAASKVASSRRICVVSGDPGSRKSSAIQKVLANKMYHQQDCFQVITPLNVLRADWAKKLDFETILPGTGKGTPRYYACTLEKALADGMSGSVVVFDEDKFPPGHMALKALLHPKGMYYIRLMDPYQTQYHDPEEDSTLNTTDMPGEGDLYAKYTSFHLIGTWRSAGAVPNFFRLPSFSKVQGQMFLSSTSVSCVTDLQPFLPHLGTGALEELLKVAIVLSPSDPDVKTSNMQNKLENISQVGSQGRDSDLVIVNFTDTSVRSSDLATMYTAMTRAKKYLICCLLYNRGNDNVARIETKPILRELEFYRCVTAPFKPVHIVPEHTVDAKAEKFLDPARKCLAGPVEKMVNRQFVSRWYPDLDSMRFIDPDARIGGGMMQFDEPAYAEAYTFKPWITELREPEAQLYTPIDHKVLDAKLKTYLPKWNESDFIETQVAQVSERYERELQYGAWYSEQFPDELQIKEDADRMLKLKSNKHFLKKDHDRIVDRTERLLELAPESVYLPRLLATAQRQRSSDTPSYLAGRKQRVKIATALENEHAFRTNTDLYGPALFKNLCKAMGWNPEVKFKWDTALWDRSCHAWQVRRGERTEAMKKASLNRAEPEFTSISIGKSQVKVKPEVAEVAKPLQTILIHHDKVTQVLGPLGIYLLDMIEAHCPAHIYLDAKKSLAAKDAWFRAHWPNLRGGFESDMSGFDAAQDENPLKCEQLIMELFSVPQEQVQFYLDSKMNTPLGKLILAIARDSGEIFTWLFNTMHTIARRHTKSIVPPETPQAYGGDDEAHPHEYKISSEWLPLAPYSHMVEKEAVVQDLTFCGFIVSSKGIVRNPEQLLRKMLIAKEMGRLRNVWAGYFLEWSIAYNKSEELQEILSDKMLDCHSVLTDIVFNIKDWSSKQLAWTEKQRKTLQANKDLERFGVSYTNFFEEFLPSFVTPDTSFVEDAAAIAFERFYSESSYGSSLGEL